MSDDDVCEPDVGVGWDPKPGLAVPPPPPIPAEEIADAIKTAFVECFGGEDGTLDVELDLGPVVEALEGCLTVDNCEGTSLDVEITAANLEALAEALAGLDVDATISNVNELAEAIADALESPPQIDVEAVCLDGTVHILTFTDGEPTGDIDTGTECGADTDIDVELACDDTTGTLHYVTFVDGVAQAATVDTGRDCAQGTPECVKWSTVNVQLDNTGTHFSEATTIEVTNTDGSVFSFVTGPHAGWSDQVADIAAQMDGFYSGLYDPRCTFLPNGCGGLLPPPSDAPAQPGIFARYINGTHCPTDLAIPLSAMASSATRTPRALPLYIQQTPERRGQRCLTCDGPPSPLLDENGVPVPEADLPVCVFACAETVPKAPLATCEFDAFEGGCDNLNQPESPDAWVSITRIVSICDGAIGVNYYIEEDDALVDYELVGDFVDCESGETLPDVVPECADFELATLYRIAPGTIDGQLTSEDFQMDADGSNPVTLANALADIGAWGTLPDGAPDPSTAGVSFGPAAPQTTLDVNDADLSGGIANANTQHIWGYLYVPEDTTFRWTGTAEGYQGVYIDKCCSGNASKIYDRTQDIGDGPEGDLFGVLPAGIHGVNIYNYDVNGFRSFATFQTSPDGGVTWVTGSGGIQLSSVKPTEQCLTVKVCKDTNALIDVLTGDILEPDSLTSCPQTCEADSQGGALDCAVTECVDPCTMGSTYIFGRPPASNAWSWGPYSGANLNEFEDALAAAGYTVTASPPGPDNEKHQICPPFGAFGENPNSLLMNGIGDGFIPTVEPNINPDFVAEDMGCAVQTVDKSGVTLADLLAAQNETNELLAQMIECVCCPDGPIQDMRCQTYSNGLTSGYRNWSDLQELEDLSGEFGILLGAADIFIRIVEFDCGGVAQPQVGQIFGPYTVPQPSGSDAFATDLAAATASACLTVGPGTSSGPNGIGSNFQMSYDSTQDATLVIQEGVIDANTGGVAWFTSAQGFTVRNGVAGDFISSSGNGATTNYAASNDFEQFAEAEECEAI